jgi:arylsulfatase
LKYKFAASLLTFLGLTLALTVIPSFTTHKSIYAQPITQTNRPNILLIIGDDFGFSDIGSFGSEIATPNLDALAREGKILTNYHTYATCSPARSTLLTGVDNHIVGLGTMHETLVSNQVGKPGYEGYLNNRSVTVAQLLKDDGYHTLMSGKWHLSGEGLDSTSPSAKGFEDSFSLQEGGAQHFSSGSYVAGHHSTFRNNSEVIPRPDNKTYSNDMYTNIMLSLLKKYQGDGKPFFAYLAFQVAHTPFQAPQEDIKKYEEVYKVGYDKIREQRFEKQKQLGIWPKDMQLPNYIPPVIPWSNLTKDQKDYRAKVMAVHAAMIDNMDMNIGRVIQYLKETGQYDNTLIVFASDNGTTEPVELSDFITGGTNPKEQQAFVSTFNNTLPNLGNKNSLVGFGSWGEAQDVSPLSGYKASQFEGGIRVPFVVKLPRNESVTNKTSIGPEIIRAFTHVIDMTPTLLEYAGIQMPGSVYKESTVYPIMGRSLKPLFDEKIAKVYNDNEVIAQELFNNAAVFMGHWKAVKNTPPLGTDKWQLFNIVNDIGENHDLAKEQPDILEKLVSAYNEYAKDVGIVVPQSGNATAPNLTEEAAPT